MAEFTPENLGGFFKQKDSESLEYFSKNLADPYYTFCFYLCLENSSHTRDLFLKVLRSAVKDVAGLEDHADIWFYRSLHKVWPRFVRFKKDLQERESDMRFDWSRQLGRQQAEALKILAPLEREIILFRFVNNYTLRRIEDVTGLKGDQLLKIFSEAVNKFAHTKI